MRIAIIGCGFVCDFYLQTLKLHPELRVAGLFDRDPRRADRFARAYGLRAYESLGALLADSEVEAVVNLTNPASHYEISRACLEAGKHVYSEKPLALCVEDARRLVELARRSRLQLSCAPGAVLNEAAQTAWKVFLAVTNWSAP